MQETRLGLRTKEACQRYDAAVRNFLWDNPQVPDNIVNHGLYLTPEVLITNGLGELQGVSTRTVMALPALPGSVPEREKHVRDLPNVVKRLSSLSINQLVKSREPLQNESEDQTPLSREKIAEARSIDVYKVPVHEVLRPYGMCPALAMLPKNEMLHGGSALEKLARLGSELIIATNLHALGINDPEYSIAG